MNLNFVMNMAVIVYLLNTICDDEMDVKSLKNRELTNQIGDFSLVICRSLNFQNSYGDFSKQGNHCKKYF